VNADEQTHLLDNLQSLLEEQIETARRGDFRRVDVLTEQVGRVVEKIVKIKSFGQPEFAGQREHLTRSFKKLELMLAAKKASVGRQLRQIRHVRKTLKTYRTNGSFRLRV